MKRIHKFFLVLGFSLALMLVPCSIQKDAKAAGLPTIDISNLIENILSKLQDQDIFGMFDGLTDHQMNYEQWFAKIEQWKTYLDYIRIVQAGARTAKEIIDIGQDMVEQTEYAYNVMQYFYERSFAGKASVYLSVCGCAEDFIEAGKYLFNDLQQKYNTFQSQGKYNPLEVIKSIDETVQRFSNLYFTACLKFRSKVANYYSIEQAYERAFADANFIQAIFI